MEEMGNLESSQARAAHPNLLLFLFVSSLGYKQMFSIMANCLNLETEVGMWSWETDGSPLLSWRLRCRAQMKAGSDLQGPGQSF